MNELTYKQRVLDAISPSFCAAKWYNATIWLGSGQTTSCHHPPAHAIDAEAIKTNPKALHNTIQKKLDRSWMWRGMRPPGCEYCWKIEDMGRDNISDRVYKSKIYPIEALYEAADTPSDDDVDLRTLEISFDRTCNFACSYCNPAFSSTWANDIRRDGPYTGLISDGRNHFTHDHSSSQLYTINEVNPYVEAFFKWWDTDLHRTLQELRITGGEPLMSGYTWKLIDWFKTHETDMRFAINSNLGAKDDLIDKMIDASQNMKHFHLYTSNEAMGSQAEYIRDGLVWSDWANNVERVLTNGRIEGFHMMCTVNALCLDSLDQFLECVMNWKRKYGKDYPTFTLNILRFPSFQSPLVLSDELRTQYKFRLQSWLDANINDEFLHNMERNQLQRLIDYLDIVKTPHMGAAEQSVLQQDFKKFYTQYDQRRGKNFTKTFPALANWYNTL